MTEQEQRKEDLKTIDEANEIDEGLNNWEMEFIESLNDWMERHETLTPPQRTKLEKILTEKG